VKIRPNHALIALSLIALAGACKDKDDEDDSGKKKGSSSTAASTSTPPPPPPPPPATTSAAVVPDTPQPSASSLAKTELDGREPDAGWAGGNLAVAKLTFVTPKDWASKSGDFTAVTSSDGGGRFTAGKYPEGAAPTGSMDAALKALGLTDCTWGTADGISLGKDKIPAQAADGNCKREGKPVKAIWVATSGKDMNVLSVGSWDEGKDNKPVLNTFRSAKAAAGGTGGDPTGIAACCAAINQNAASAPLQYKGAYIAAAGACQAAMNNPQGKAALGSVRGLLAAAGVPAACR
jgi:hypothetical protein